MVVLHSGPDPAASESGVRRDRIAGLLLALALAVGLLRFWRLSQWSLWIDEALTWTDLFVGIEGGEITNPLGYRLIGATVRLFGGVPDEFALRFLPALAGTVSIPIVAWAFRPFVGARRSAAAALLVAASTWHVYWSQNARFYTLAQAVSLVGAALVLRGYWSGRLAPTVAGFAVAASAALFHPSAAILLPALALAPLVLRLARAPMPRGIVRCALAVLALGVLALLVNFAWLRETFENYQRQKGSRAVLEDLGPAFGRVAHLLKTTGFYVTPLLGAAALVGAAIALRRREAFGSLAAVTCALVLVAAVLLAMFARMAAQYVFFLLPWVAVLAALPLEDRAIGGRATAVRWPLLAILVLPALATTALYFTVRRGERPQWRDAYEFVWNRREEFDLVLGMEATVGEYYVAPLRTELRQPLHVAWLDRWRARVPEEWAEHARRTWYLVNPEQFLDWDPADAADFQRMLREECRLVKCFPLYVESRDLSVWIYLRD